ncbi:MAG: hypothetical protein ACR2OZ_06210 [Verrucomicrobiales bacterium]
MVSAKLTTAAVVLISAVLSVSVRLAGFQWSGSKPKPTLQSSSTREASTPSDTSAILPAAPTLDLSLVQQAINRLLANLEDYQTQLELRRLMFSLSAEEIPAVLELLMAVPGKKKESLYEVCHALFARWAELDPATAAQAAFAVPKSAYNLYPLRGAFLTWAAVDLDTAWAWLAKTTSDPMDREFLGGEALAAIIAIQGNGTAMMTRVDAMTDHAWRDKLRFWVLRSWVKSDAPATVMDWALKLPDDAERPERIAKTVEQLGAYHPDDCFDYIRHIENSDRRAEVAHNIFWPYVLNRPDSLWKSSPDPVQELAKHTEDWPEVIFRDAGDALTRHNSARALEKAQTLPEGKARDEFIQGMLTGVSYGDAAAMLPALSMISEEKLIHHGGLGNFTGVFAKQNPRAAAEWITSLPQTSKTATWADSHFQGVTGRSVADFLTPSPK